MIKRFRSSEGQAIVEFAFVLPLLCIIVVGLIEFGVLFYDKAAVTNASREGARVGMTFTTVDGSYWAEGDMQAAVSQKVNDYLQTRLISFGGPATINTVATRTNVSPRYNYDAYMSATEGKVDVVVTYTHRYLALPSFMGWGRTINISAETVMRLE